MLMLLVIDGLLGSDCSGRPMPGSSLLDSKGNAQTMNSCSVVKLREVYCHSNSIPAGLFNV